MLKPFQHKNARSVNEAAGLLEGGNAALIAGGTDLLGQMKDMILPDYPETVVNIKTIPGLDYIKEEGTTLKIGAATRLADIAENATVNRKYTALAEAAKAVAAPNLRQMGTIGGNLAQLPRCWYFRKPDNRFPCLRKGGSECYAATGENRYHSMMGGSRTHVSECTQACPAATNIPVILEYLRKGDWDKAAETYLQVNPMPMLTGRVCAHFCQQNCNRCGKDEGVQHGAVERTVGDYMLKNADKFYAKPTKDTGKTVAIVGSGPAGLSAAFYLRKAGNKVVVYDTKPEAGGMLRYAIPAYRLPKDLVSKYISILEGMGIEFKLNVKLGETIKPEQLEKDYDSVLYATGAWKRPVLGFSGEEMTVFGLDFLVQVKEWMNGKVGQEVVVMGGGNVAMDVAITAKRLGAKHVRLTCLEAYDKMPASREEIARAEEEGIEIDAGWGLVATKTDANGKITGLEVKKCLRTIDEHGRFNPAYDEARRKVITGENILLATGQGVDLSYLDEKYQIQLERNRIATDVYSGETSRAGVFAAGEVTTGAATVIGSIDNGHKSANGITRYLGGDVCNCGVNQLEEYTSFDEAGIKKLDGLKLKELDASARAIDKEDSETPAQDDAITEAKRCLDCSCYAVNPSDTAPALIALDAKIVTNHRTIDAEELFAARVPSNTLLGADEIITEIQIPQPPAGAKSHFVKFAIRKTIDFAVVDVALLIGVDKPRIALNAVAPKPIRALEAEKLLAGKTIDEATAAAVGEAAVTEAMPLEQTKYKVQIAKTIVKRALLAAAA